MTMTTTGEMRNEIALKEKNVPSYTWGIPQALLS